jgi:hypothetical protein
LAVVIDGVTRELVVQVVPGLAADVIVGMSDCARWGMRWIPAEDGSLGVLHLAQQRFGWDRLEGLFVPWIFVPVQASMEDDDPDDIPISQRVVERVVQAERAARVATAAAANFDGARTVRWTDLARSTNLGGSVPALVAEDVQALGDPSVVAARCYSREHQEPDDPGIVAARRIEGIWHDFTVEDIPPVEEVEDLAKLEAPPSEASAEDRRKVIATLLERSKGVPGGGGAGEGVHRYIREYPVEAGPSVGAAPY